MHVADKTKLIIGAVVGAASLLAIAWWVFAVLRKYEPTRRPLQFEELARIQETVMFSFGGIVAVLAMVIFNLAMPVLLFVGIVAPVLGSLFGAAWIAGNVLWATCVIVGRRRDYRIIRYLPPPSDRPRDQ